MIRRCRGARLLLCLVISVLLASCAAPPAAVKPDNFLERESKGWSGQTTEQLSPPPEFVPVTEDLVPVKTKVINVVVRNSALGDVLHVVAEAGGLNLLIDRGVPLDQPVTLSLKNVVAEDALSSIFSTVDCFYTVTGNVLRVESVGTRFFELGHPALVGSYAVDVGGDILGGTTMAVTGGVGSSSLKGTITSGTKGDSKAFDFWESLEKSLDGIIGKKDYPVLPALRTAELRNQLNQQELNSSERGSGGESEIGRLQQGVTVNRLTGTIMVTATRKNMEKVERYLGNVKKVLNRQVMIEVRIIEVQLNDGLNFGIDWSFLKNVNGLGGTLGAGFGALDIATGKYSDATKAAAAANQFQVGISRADFQALLTALSSQGEVKTLSNPRVNVMNGHTSVLTVGRNTSYIAQAVSTTSTGTTPITTFSVQTGSILSGMIIGIVPYISDSGDISINITPITSNLVSLVDKSIGSVGNQLTITIPTVDLREMTTTVTMKDGQIVILGGLISKQESVSEDKVPLLGDLPYLGKLFTHIKNSTSRSELVLMIRPRILFND
jgi:MSHA type pilus biogenesis protein MshL